MYRARGCACLRFLLPLSVVIAVGVRCFPFCLLLLSILMLVLVFLSLMKDIELVMVVAVDGGDDSDDRGFQVCFVLTIMMMRFDFAVGH